MLHIRSNDGKVIGEYDSIDKVFFKKVRGSAHMLREPLAWAIDSVVVDTLDNLDCEEIQVTDRENGKEYVVEFATFQEKAIIVDRGYGEQKALPLNYWTVIQPGAQPGNPI